MNSFDEERFEASLEALKNSQSSIQFLSSWCLQNHEHVKKIITCWLNVLQRVRIEQRLTLFYLANDVIQYSKLKQLEFVDFWKGTLLKATEMVRDEKIKQNILRIFKIWQQRQIYSKSFTNNLKALLDAPQPERLRTAAENTADDFQNADLVYHISNCAKLAKDAKESSKMLPKSESYGVNVIKQQINSGNAEKTVEQDLHSIQIHMRNLEAEIKSRKELISATKSAINFYDTQFSEFKVVARAYENLGKCIKNVKNKLTDVIPTLPSPQPSLNTNAPSPNTDADLHLPDDSTKPISFNSFNNNISHLNGKMPFDINCFKNEKAEIKPSSQPHEVIGSRSDNENFHSSFQYTQSSAEVLPGHIPMPAPPVQPEYTSLARSAMIGSNTMPRSNISSSGYLSIEGYGVGNSSSPFMSLNFSSANRMHPMLPPPPMPPSVLLTTGDGPPGLSAQGNVSDALVHTPINSQQQQEIQQQQYWHQMQGPWNGSGVAGNVTPQPPPRRQPVQMIAQHMTNNKEYNPSHAESMSTMRGGAGIVVGASVDSNAVGGGAAGSWWPRMQQNQYARNRYPRSYGSPYFRAGNRGRGSFRGKFRENVWQ